MFLVCHKLSRFFELTFVTLFDQIARAVLSAAIKTKLKQFILSHDKNLELLCFENPQRNILDHSTIKSNIGLNLSKCISISMKCQSPFKFVSC